MSNDVRSVLAQFRNVARSEREKGTYFERLAVAFLKNDPGMAQEYEDAWPFGDWAKAHGVDGRDTGIDAVAKLRNQEGFCAIQCKFYREGHRIQKADLDSFFTASGKQQFTRRLIIDTTDTSWSDNAESALVGQQVATTRIGLDRLEQSLIDWSAFLLQDTIVVASKKEPRPHQIEAVDCVKKGFAEHNRGKVIMACGTGKTFTALKVAETLVGAGGSVLYLVPSLSLMSQSVREWTIDGKTPLRAFAVCSDIQVGKRRVSNDDAAEIEAHDLDYPATTDAKKLAREVVRSAPERMTVVFATYQSIQTVADAQTLHGLSEFDLIICDEAHRTTGATFPGEEESNFVKVHDAAFVRAKKRLYMTATPRVFGDNARTKASEASVELCSMDDEALFGPTFFTRGFGWAVQNGLLTDYKVIVLAVDEAMVSASIQRRLADGTNELKLDDATKIVGCYKALTKAGLKEDVGSDTQPMQRALAFAKDIATSKLITAEFAAVVEDYLASEEGQEVEDGRTPLRCELEHVDGTFGAKRRTERLDWLKAGDGESTCRILSNARCLSEGVDVPALDAILFLHPRKSQIDVVQSVGRVMRRAEGKRMGYVILPIGVPAGMTPEEALNDNERYRVVWQILNALRSHDERFDATINKMDLGVDVSDHIEVVAISNKLPNRAEKSRGTPNIGYGSAASNDADNESTVEAVGPDQIEFIFDEFTKAIMAKIAKKCGTRDYWEDWATNIADIAKNHITRLKSILALSNSEARNAFDGFFSELKDGLNDSISEEDAIEMLAQHIITRPVFEALFDGHEFTSENPVSLAMQRVIDVLDRANLDKESKDLQKFYASVKMRAAGIKEPSAKQKLIVELYDKFFRKAFARTTEKLGIVYTPVEIVDFIIHSVQSVLIKEFGLSITSKDVHIVDPFTGTGTFIARLLQSGLIAREDLERKFRHEIHANEIVLLAYYIAAINIEAVYNGIVGGKYVPFEGICLTDTFQMYEGDDLISHYMPDNSTRRKRQKSLDIQVVLGNPPYSGQQGSENENNKNTVYTGLDARIRETYAKASSSKLAKSNYDSYVRAIRWASDRIKDRGVVAFVTNGSFIDAKNMDGLRKSLSAEFGRIYVFDLRGDQRTSGEASKREGGKVFGSGSRTPVAITLLVKNPQSSSLNELNYYDIGDYLSREEKLQLIGRSRSIENIKWSQILPNKNGDWINQRDPLFNTFLPLAGRDSDNSQSIFVSNSYGVVTNRDPWVYNSSTSALEASVRSLIGAFNEESEKYRNACVGLTKESWPVLEDVVSSDPRRISWSRALKKDAERGKSISFDSQSIIAAAHRPFGRQFMYFDRRLNEMVNLTKRMFPTIDHSNIVISCTGVTDRKGFSCLVTDQVPSMHLTDTGMCYPLYHYEKPDAESGDLFVGSSENLYVRRDGISDWATQKFHAHYNDPNISKEDIFWYTYAMLHSPEYREKFRSDLQKVHPRLPMTKDFQTYSAAGRALGFLHLNFDGVEPYPVTFRQGDLSLTTIVDAASFFRVVGMKFKGKRGGTDKSTVIYNSNITIENIPLDAYNYVVNGKSALEWVMERQGVKVDKDSNISNDTNLYANETKNDPAYPLKLFQQVITVSLETMKIVRSLPSLELDSSTPAVDESLAAE